MLQSRRQFTLTVDYEKEPLNDFDVELAQIELDPMQARFHPRLFRVNFEKVEASIDAIYCAADAGNPRARFLILAAAINQINSAGDDAQAFDEKMEISKTEIDIVASGCQRENVPLERETAIAVLDRSIAAIELAIEDAGLAQEQQTSGELYSIGKL